MPRLPTPSSPPPVPEHITEQVTGVDGRASRPATPRAVALAAAVDAACVLGFAAAGRSSHARDGGLVGILGTAWPFLVAAAVGWVAVRAWRAPLRPWPAGVGVWALAWLGGLALRAVTGGGTAPTFVLVAGLVLGALLVGWRVVATALSPVARRRRQARPARGR